MPFSHIFEKDQPKIFFILKNLSAYPPKEGEKKKKLMISKMKEIFESLEEYLKKLPNPASSITCGDRVVIYNSRQILSSISLVIDMEVKSLYKKCKKAISKKESALKAEDTSTDKITLKPKLRKVKRQLPPVETLDVAIRDNILPFYSDMKYIATVQGILWPGETFLEDIREAEHLQSDILLREPEIPAQIPDDQTFRESLPVPLMESTKLGPALDSIRLPHLMHEDALEIELPREDSRQRIPISVPITQQEFVHPRHEAGGEKVDYDILMKKIENIISVSPPEIQKSVRKEKRSPKQFVKKPYMDTNEYIKFLESKPKNPVKFYTNWGDDLDKYFHEPTEQELIEGDMFEHIYLIEEPEGEIPLGEVYLRDTNLEPPENIHEISIPEFEFRPVEPMQEAGKQAVDRTSYLEPIRADISQNEREIDDRAVPLDDLPIMEKTIIDLPPVQQSLYQEEGTVIGDSLPEIPEPRITVGVSPRRLAVLQEREDELWFKLNQLCCQRENSTIVFTDLCSLSESRLNASRIFCSILDFWSQNKIKIRQASDNPNDIYIKLQGNLL